MAKGADFQRKKRKEMIVPFVSYKCTVCNGVFPDVDTAMLHASDNHRHDCATQCGMTQESEENVPATPFFDEPTYAKLEEELSAESPVLNEIFARAEELKAPKCSWRRHHKEDTSTFFRAIPARCKRRLESDGEKPASSSLFHHGYKYYLNQRTKFKAYYRCARYTRMIAARRKSVGGVYDTATELCTGTVSVQLHSQEVHLGKVHNHPPGECDAEVL